MEGEEIRRLERVQRHLEVQLSDDRRRLLDAHRSREAGRERFLQSRESFEAVCTRVRERAVGRTEPAVVQHRVVADLVAGLRPLRAALVREGEELARCDAVCRTHGVRVVEGERKLDLVGERMGLLRVRLEARREGEALEELVQLRAARREVEMEVEMEVESGKVVESTGGAEALLLSELTSSGERHLTDRAAAGEVEGRSSQAAGQGGGQRGGGGRWGGEGAAPCPGRSADAPPAGWTRDPVREIEALTAWQGAGRAGVELTWLDRRGRRIEVRIECAGEKVLRVELRPERPIDRVRLWGERHEILSALRARGYTVRDIRVGGGTGRLG